MKTFDVKCPACGRINHNLFLEETEGWMECEDCGTLVTAYQNSKGEFKVACPCCRAVMVRIQKGRRRDTIELYAPKGQEHIASD